MEKIVLLKCTKFMGATIMKKRLVFFSCLALLFFGISNVSADVIDLTTGNYNDWHTGSDGSYWRVVDSTPTGTGVYQPFLRYQANPVETGMNTNAPGVYDNKMPAGKYTRAVLFSDLGVVNYLGSDYWSFTIDFNEPGADTRYLSFDNFDIYQGPTANENDYSTLGPALFDSSDTILTDYTLASSGSGNDDIEFLIPVAAWVDPYMYLYITSGGYNPLPGAPGFGKNWEATDGFEEIRTTGIPAVPEPATMLLFGIGLLSLAGINRKR